MWKDEPHKQKIVILGRRAWAPLLVFDFYHPSLCMKIVHFHYHLQGEVQTALLHVAAPSVYTWISTCLQIPGSS